MSLQNKANENWHFGVDISDFNFDDRQKDYARRMDQMEGQEEEIKSCSLDDDECLSCGS